MATTIATLTEKTDGTLEGVFATIRVNAPIALVPNASKASEEAPDYRIIHRKTGFEIGAGWNKVSGDGEPFISVTLDDPSFNAPINAALWPSEADGEYALIWNRPKRES